MGTHLKVLRMSHPMNTNMTGFGCFSMICVLVLWTKVASALEGLICHANSFGEGLLHVNSYITRNPKQVIKIHITVTGRPGAVPRDSTQTA